MKIVIVIGGANENDVQLNLADRFKLEARDLVIRLYQDLKILNEENYLFLNGLDFKLFNQLEEWFLENRGEDVLLFYIGHGQENGWSLDGKERGQFLEYQQLGMIFVGHTGNLIFINDCCYAGAAEKALEKRWSPYLLIATMPEDRFGYATNFLKYLFGDWVRCEYFSPEKSLDNPDFTPIVYGDPSLQKLLFAKIKSAD